MNWLAKCQMQTLAAVDMHFSEKKWVHVAVRRKM